MSRLSSGADFQSAYLGTCLRRPSKRAQSLNGGDRCELLASDRALVGRTRKIVEEDGERI